MCLLKESKQVLSCFCSHKVRPFDQNRFKDLICMKIHQIHQNTPKRNLKKCWMMLDDIDFFPRPFLSQFLGGRSGHHGRLHGGMGAQPHKGHSIASAVLDLWQNRHLAPRGPEAPWVCHGLGKGDGPRKWKNGKVQHVLICLKLNLGVSKVSSLLKPARGEDNIIQHCQKMEICLMCPQNEESDE